MRTVTAILLVAVMVCCTACAYDISNGKYSADVTASGTTFTSGQNQVTVVTVIDGKDFAPVETKEESGKVTFSSGEKTLFLLDGPIIRQDYEVVGEGLKDTVYLKEPRELSYRFKGGSLSLEQDGSVKIDTGDADKYLVMLPATGTDADGKPLAFDYTVEKDTVRVIIPKDAKYPLIIDPVIEPRYYLKLLLHNNIEAADGFSTTVVRDSSPYLPKMPYFMGASSADYNLNATAPKYGNASAFLRGTANITVADNNDFYLAGNNFTLCANVNWSTAVHGIGLFNQTQSSSVYQRFYVVDSGSALYWAANNGGGGIEVATYTFAGGYIPVAGKNYQFCAIKNGSVVNLTMNGTSIGTGTSTTITHANVAAPVVIGMNSSTAGAAVHVDEVWLFNGWAAPISTALMQEWPLYSNATPNYGYGDDNSTIALLHFDGSDGGTLFRDEVGNRSWTATGGAVIATNASKFSPSSLFTVGSGRYISTTNTSAFNYGSGDFTEEIWFNASAYPAAAGYLWSHVNNSVGVANNQSYARLTAAGRIRYGIADNGAAETLTITSDANQPAPLNVWNHLAVVRNGTTIKMYLNGSETASGTYAGTMPLSNSAVTVGGTPLSAAYSFNGWLDEFRATSGTARWTGNFTPPSAPFGITNPGFTMNSTAYGTVPVAVQFNSTTPDDAWTQNGWYWEFGDGSTSTEQNPVHTYTTAGNYLANLTTINNNMSATSSSTTFSPGAPVITVTASPNEGEPYLESTITVYVTNTTPITAWGFQWCEDAGYCTSDTTAPTYRSGSGTSTVWERIHNFDRGYWTVTVNATNSIGMDTANTTVSVKTPQSRQNTWYTPHEVAISIVDSKYNPVPDAFVNCSIDESTLPEGWLEKLFGLQPTVSQVIENGTLVMSGNTDTTGKIVFTMVSSVGYNVSILNPYDSITYNKMVYPVDSRYTITLVGAVPNNTYQDMGINTTLWMSEPNTSYGTMNLNYTDISGRTNNVTFWVIARVNNTVIYSDFVTNPGTSTVMMNRTIQNVKGTAYTFGYTANRTV